ncbi:MAG TPA: VCBS repeat-containing protein [Bacteroidales bacterium]|nr:VCBS repeat-containing protein [Bacteroidales bacterium]
MILISYSLVSCSSFHPDHDREKLFSLLDSKRTHIGFINQLHYTEEYNTYTYRNFYNGAGVGLGDFNNDGLPDIYFCGNLTGNKLYINKGNFVFEDVTEKAGVGCDSVWSTGVSIADINGDGWLDIYICKSGATGGKHRYNELFINNGDLTFTEKAREYGLADVGLSNHAAFFDYDRDGDLDCYLLNNSFQSVSDFDLKAGERDIRDKLGANKLYRNDNGHFTDVSKEAGIYGSKIGFGLGVCVGDVNRDGWPDIYISNDFFERDYLYINNRNGTFTEALEDQMREISLGAMGGDMADINNDAYPEIFATEMTPEGNARLKTKALFENWEQYQDKVSKDYYHQFARNVLQLNNRNNTFSEIGRLSGVSYTDWSWGALIMDLDNDGWKDIFVANGIFKDLLDRDYLDIYSNPAMMRSMIKTETQAILKLIDMMPSVKIPNYAFHNNHDLTFTNFSPQWGLDIPSFSNGAAYGDLDNDGDLDLVVNTVNMPPLVYRNELNNISQMKWLEIGLKGVGENTAAIGSEVTIYYNGKINYAEQIPARGFQSSVDNRLHFGLDTCSIADSVSVNWPDGKCSVYYNIPADQIITLDEKEPSKYCIKNTKTVAPALFTKIAGPEGLNFSHKENNFNDFDRDRLLFQMMSNEGPHIAKGDVNNDGLTDLYFCGAKDSPGELYIQNRRGSFRKASEPAFEKDRVSEDTDCAFFDADGDGDQDLYVASGGNEFPLSSSALADRLYINDGKGHFTRADQLLPAGKYESTACVKPDDFDHDGDIDLFVGIRLHPFEYGVSVNGYLLENDGKGHFTNSTAKRAPGLTGTGMITDMAWADVDNDGDDDIVIVGDWMPVEIFINDKGMFRDESAKFGLKNTEGWWHKITACDLNGDGRIDFVLGNNGLNSRFKATVDKPVTMYVNDFDMNGSVEQIICEYFGDKSYPVVMKNDLVKQIPSLERKYKKFADYKDATIDDIFSPEVLKRTLKKYAKQLKSCIMMNTDSGTFRLDPLPLEAQFSPVYGIVAKDFDNDGKCDIIIGGNQYRQKPEVGINDASYGLFLKNKGNDIFEAVPAPVSGISTKGEIRDFKVIHTSNKNIIIVARNNDSLQFYKY